MDLNDNEQLERLLKMLELFGKLSELKNSMLSDNEKNQEKSGFKEDVLKKMFEDVKKDNLNNDKSRNNEPRSSSGDEQESRSNTNDTYFIDVTSKNYKEFNYEGKTITVNATDLNTGKNAVKTLVGDEIRDWIENMCDNDVDIPPIKGLFTNLDLLVNKDLRKKMLDKRNEDFTNNFFGDLVKNKNNKEDEDDDNDVNLRDVMSFIATCEEPELIMIMTVIVMKIKTSGLDKKYK